MNRRSSGILLHVTSLPGPYGIGDLGPAAHAWVDWLAAGGQTWWQILPLGPPGAGDSPYQCYSAFAGNPLVISPEVLIRDGLVSRRDVPAYSGIKDRVDFDKVAAFKDRLLGRAFEKFRGGGARKLAGPFQRFKVEESDWLDDFALFMALRRLRPGVDWTQWPRELLVRKADALRSARESLREQIERIRFEQFLFFRQLGQLRSHAAKRGVKLIGDLPMFVSPESSDVWANRHLFKLDLRGRPKVVAGVPPDYFSKDGQRWGNPLYNWPAHERERFDWWTRRIEAALRQADLLRLDHFRGLQACWEVPASSPTARRGRWVRSPGAKLLKAVRRKLKGLPLIAEDLGLITPDVEKLRDDFGLPGMRVLQFGFGGDAANPHLAHNFLPRSVAYTGTHDNDTSAGWWRSLSKSQKRHARRYVPGIEKDPARSLIRLAWESVAELAIAPAQDVLGLGSEARMNVPGSANGNWNWRLREAPSLKHAEELRSLTELYGRAG